MALTGCASGIAPPHAQHRGIRVAASNTVQLAFPELSRACLADIGVEMQPIFAGTNELARRISSGGAFDIFLTDDSLKLDSLIDQKFCQPAQLYALGRLALWIPRRPDILKLADVSGDSIRSIALAPDGFGRAAQQSLIRTNLREALGSRLVTLRDSREVTACVESGHCDGGFTPLSLVDEQTGSFILIPSDLHEPIPQYVCKVSASVHQDDADRVIAFLTSPGAALILQHHGFDLPARQQQRRRGSTRMGFGAVCPQL